MTTIIRRMLLVAVLAPFATQAADRYDASRSGYDTRYANLSYTLGEVRLLAQDPDGGDDADGVSVGGSLLIHPDFFLSGALATVGSDDRDTDSFRLGVGYRYAMSPRVDLLGIAGLIRVDTDFGNGRDDDDFGPTLTGGARAALTHALEVGGYLNYVEVFGDGDLGIAGEGLYHLTPNFSLLAGIGLSDDDREANIGARWNFQPTR